MSTAVITPRQLTATVVVCASDALETWRASWSASLGRYLICDGINDEVEIQAAFNALAASGGRIVLLEGTYLLSKTGATTYALNFQGKNNVTIEGQGFSTILKMADNQNINLIEVGAAATLVGNWIIKEIYFDGNKTNNGVLGRAIVGSLFNSSIHHCYFHNFKTESLFLEGSLATGSYGLMIDHNISNGCDGLDINFNAYVDDCWIDNNTLGSSYSGIMINTSSGTIWVTNNYFSQHTIYSLQIFRSSNIWIRDNIFDSGGTAGIRVGAPDATVQDFRIIDNFFYRGTGSLILLQPTGAWQIGDIIILGNTVQGENQPTNWVSFGGTAANYARVVIADNIITGVPTFISGSVPNIDHIYNKHSDLFMDVLAVSANYVVNAQTLAVNPTVCAIAAQPDCPRTLSYAITHPTLTAFTLTFVGVDAKGNSVTEVFTQATGWTGETSNAFATVTSITMSAMTGNTVADTIDVGITDVLGLSNEIYATTDVYKIKKNNANAVVAAAQVNTTYDTYDMAVIGLAATDDFTIYFKSNLNIVA